MVVTIRFKGKGSSSVADKKTTAENTISCQDDPTSSVTIDWTPSQGKVPRFLCLDPAGAVLYVVNESTHTIVRFALDQHSGLPSPTGEVFHPGSPSFIAFSSRESASESLLPFPTCPGQSGQVR